MAGPKKGLPPPIDRPLSKAYLREFTGWSCAYPPGISDPTSLRLMQNIMITREGAAAIRPALRSVLAQHTFFDTSYSFTAVGNFEPFYLNDGRKALLFAVRETVSGTQYVGFRVAVYNTAANRFDIQTISSVFTVSGGLTGATGLYFSSGTTYVTYVQIDNKVFALSDNGETFREFFVGPEKIAKSPDAITVPSYTPAHRPTVFQPTAAWVAGAQTTIPTGITKSGTTLESTTTADNKYNFAYFYSFNNDVGESMMSMITLIKVQRAFDLWVKDVSDESKSADQLAVVIPGSVYDTAVAQGATSWNLYGLRWTDQAPVPTEAILLKTTSMVAPATKNTASWATHTPLLEGLDAGVGLPNAKNQYNYSEPSKASNGLVAGDRLVLVGDKTKQAVIKWTSSRQGNYTNFSSSVGGGYKTLTSGNLYIPAAVKLWQNPQSVDSITILCLGTNGYSTAYYMNPNTSITGQSQNTGIVGFEETTATPGTVSPYGCEVINSALYHPIDHALMKSTASNYNITHKTMTDMIQNRWVELKKNRIISSQLDNRLYLIVDNPFGATKPTGCNGNEIWVYDTAGGEAGTWSKFLIPAVSLKRLEMAGKLFMCVIAPDSFYVLDDLEVQDNYNNDGVTGRRAIPWSLETNTQGANRAHDAWCHLQQANVTVGNFWGRMRYGIRGWDMNGKPVEISKVFRAEEVVINPQPVNPGVPQSDQDDYLLIRKDLKEWRFFAESEFDNMGELADSYGQINLVQYRYTPVTVNIGYEFGSIETFEYGRDSQTYLERSTDNGVPKPNIDIGRP